MQNLNSLLKALLRRLQPHLNFAILILAAISISSILPYLFRVRPAPALLNLIAIFLAITLLILIIDAIVTTSRPSLPLALLITFLLAITLVYRSVFILPQYSHAELHMEQLPTLKVINRTIADGDAAFRRRAYREAGELYASALRYLNMLKVAGSSSAAEGAPTYDYLEASIVTRDRLAEIGVAVVEGRHGRRQANSPETSITEKVPP